MANESKLQNRCIQYLKQLEADGCPIMHFRRESTGRNIRKGLPDLFVVCKKFHLEVEFKSPDGRGRTSPLQDFYAERFKAMTTPYLLCDDFESFKTFIHTYLDGD